MKFYQVAFLDFDKIAKLIYSLAYNKTLAERSKMSVDQVSSVINAPTSVSYGDNFSMATFKKWVKEEYVFQLGQYHAACAKGPESCVTWLEGRTRARNKYYNTNISAQNEFASHNKKMSEYYAVMMREAATVQFAAETALTAIGLFAAAPASLSILAGRIVVGAGSGFLISVAEQWSTAKSADLILSPITDAAGTTLATNLPGAANDTVNAFDGLNKLSVSELKSRVDFAEKQMRNANRAYRASSDAKVRASIKDDMSALRSQRNKDLARINELRTGSPNARLTGTANAIGKGLTFVCWGLAIKAEVDSFNKLTKHWRGEI